MTICEDYNEYRYGSGDNSSVKDDVKKGVRNIVHHEDLKEMTIHSFRGAFSVVRLRR